MTTLSVGISTRNRGVLIAETLEALLRVQTPAFDVIVVDQSTDDVTRQTVEEIARGDPRVRYYRSATVGSSKGRNLAAELSGANIIAFTDDDCIVADDWLRVILHELSDTSISAVYGRLLPYEYVGRTGADTGLKDSLRRVEYSTRVPPWHIGHGGNMAFRRQDLLDAGGFDPALGAGAPLRSNEDGDISYRLLAANKRVVYCPAALAFHKQWKAWPLQQQMERAYGVGAGAQFTKYVRCGDVYGVQLLCTWMWQLGVRRLGAGLLKWRSRKVMYLGYCQLTYPWVGVWKSLRYAIDNQQTTYVA